MGTKVEDVDVLVQWYIKGKAKLHLPASRWTTAKHCCYMSSTYPSGEWSTFECLTT